MRRADRLARQGASRQGLGLSDFQMNPTPRPQGAWYRVGSAAGVSGAKLHIGCGVKRLPGWINADGVAGVGDVVMDLQSDFEPQTYSIIYGSHVLEHVWPEDTPGILHRLFAALLPGGTLRLSVPDIRLAVKNCIDSHAYGDERSALSVIYGGTFSKNTSAPDLHRQAFWKERLERLLVEAGFVNIREWGRGQYPAIDALKDFATYPFDLTTGKSLISLNLEADRPGQLPKSLRSSPVDVSVILGTVDRGQMFLNCIESVRKSVEGLNYEIVVAYGRDSETNLPWMRRQSDIVPVLGGMDGAIEAFNRAYEASRGRYVCQINDDVLVDGDAIARAVRVLDEENAAAGVVFKFDRNDGKGYRHESVAGALHPNQMVVRRETCEAVVERIGAFWGDEAHRTDKTYGGDTAFGVVCKHLGLTLISVDGVTCRDLLAADALRTQNAAAVSDEHRTKWRAMYTPYMSSVVAPRPDEWPNLYVPRPGRLPRFSPLAAGRPLRLLHLSLRSYREPQIEMREALAKIGPTVEIPWLNNMRAALTTAEAHKPEVVLAQIQSDDWTSENTQSLRAAVGPLCTLVLWTGDVRTHAQQRVERWLAQAGREFDIVLAANTTYPRKLKIEERVPAACGYMTCGVEPPAESVLAVQEDKDAGAVFFGSNYTTLDHGARLELFTKVSEANPCPLTIYGTGWDTTDLRSISRPFMHKLDSRAVIRQTPLTIVTSLFTDLGRYTSDRLPRTATAGGVLVVRKFDDMHGLGLRNGVNCLVWEDTSELIAILREWSRPARAKDRRRLRDNAVELAWKTLTWDHAVQEFLAIVRDYRNRQGRP